MQQPLNGNEENFIAITKILKNHSIFFWIDQGTLLGITRDQHLIPWDQDVDLSVWSHDFSKLDGAIDDFREAGFYVENHDYKDAFFLGHPNGYTVEIAKQTAMEDYVLRKNALPRNSRLSSSIKVFLSVLPTFIHFPLRHFARKFLSTPSVVFQVPICHFEEFASISFLGIDELRVPKHTDGYLAFKYGANWKTPTRTWDYSKDDGAAQLG